MRFVALLVIVMLSGCIQQSDTGADVPGGPTTSVAWPEPETRMLSLSLHGAAWNVEALHWPVPDATTAILLIHGHSGVKENYFHTLPDANSTLGGRLAMTGRTIVAIDLPGYGASDGDPNAVNFELMAEAVRSTADALRAGQQGFAPHDRVVAYGLSMGAIVVNMAAVGDSLDAIIPAGFPQTPMTRQGIECIRNPNCPAGQDVFHDDFYIPNTDWEVANATIAGYESGQHDVNYLGYAAWVGLCAANTEGLDAPCPDQQPGHAVAAQINIPIYTLVGDHDILWLGTDLSREPTYYPNAPVETWVVPAAGHFIHNHLHQPEVVSRIDAWLVGHGL